MILFLVTCLISQAQTAIIAHKSHSGTAADFFVDPSGNFGGPAPRLVQVIRLNDSTSIEVIDHWDEIYRYDTVYKNPIYADYNLNIDSIREGFYDHVEYINFKNSPDSFKIKSPAYIAKPFERVQQTNTKQEQSPRKKKRSYLLFLFGITGSGMLLMRLFSSAKNTKPSIAG